MTEKAGDREGQAPDPEVEKKLAEKDRDFKRACQRYARIRSRNAR